MRTNLLSNWKYTCFRRWCGPPSAMFGAILPEKRVPNRDRNQTDRDCLSVCCCILSFVDSIFRVGVMRSVSERGNSPIRDDRRRELNWLMELCISCHEATISNNSLWILMGNFIEIVRYGNSFVAYYPETGGQLGASSLCWKGFRSVCSNNEIN